MPLVGFEPMIPVFERAKTVHALNRAATVIGKMIIYWTEFHSSYELSTQRCIKISKYEIGKKLSIKLSRDRSMGCLLRVWCLTNKNCDGDIQTLKDSDPVLKSCHRLEVHFKHRLVPWCNVFVLKMETETISVTSAIQSTSKRCQTQTRTQGQHQRRSAVNPGTCNANRVSCLNKEYFENI
jgi:hypothetical protein